MRGGGGGWMGPERSLGGMPRVFGLHRQFEEGGDSRMPRIRRATPRRVGGYLLPYWRQWLVIFLCVGASAGFGVIPPLLVRGILDRAIPHHDPRLLAFLVLGMIALNIVLGLIGVLQSYLNARVGQDVMVDLRNDLYRHVQRMSLRFYTTTRAGEIISRINNDVGAVYGVVMGTLIAIVSNFLTVLATLIAIFSLSPQLALLAMVVVPSFYLPTRLVGRVRRRLSTETQEKQADVLAFMQERLNIGGMLLTKGFGQAGADAAEFADRSREVADLQVRQAMAGRWLFMSLSVISVAGPALVYWYGGWQAMRTGLTIGTIIAVVSYLTNLYRPIGAMANVYVDVQGALAVFERIFEYLDLEPEVLDRPNAIVLDQAEGRIVFEGVTFTYPKPLWRPPEEDENGAGDAPEPALRDLSFRVEPGQRVALVGPSGAGKTTVTYLVPRLYDPDSGVIALDGRDLREVTQESLRVQIGMVTQETFLFHASVRENLLYARAGATDDEIIAACRAGQIHDFIAGLPEGYDTVVGERAFRLSGGEKQRLAIARALLKDPRILILDEATSNLDATSEHLVKEALATLLEGRTSLIIAHRLSTILQADQILVMDHGRLVEQGRHVELLAHAGLYATLYHRQFEGVVGGQPPG
ncbi:MAG: ABC transporter ATP-binding protein [Armatimonadetes bacterium]|nr:ABC transporter ATP-binding protein [Armatimonadota bacterium]